MIFRAKVVWFSAAEGQILGLSFMMMSKILEDFHDLVKQECGYIWDGKGWIKEVSYQ